MPTIPTDFIPADFDAGDFDTLEPRLRELLDRPIADAAEFEQWLIDRSELEAAYSETQAKLYIAMTCNTDDERAAGAYSAFIETVPPRVKPLAFALDRRQVLLHRESGLEGGRYGVLARGAGADVELFREENIPLEVELAKLSQRYDTVIGAMTVEFDGAERTLPQMGKYQESTDRAVRERSWRAVAERRLRDAETIGSIYDRQVELRDTVGRNAGFPGYTGFAFRSMHRFDYGPDECAAFHEACARIVAPFARRLDAKRRAALGLSSLRPWDVAVDIRGRGPLEPFAGGADLVSKTAAALRGTDPRLAAMFAELGDGSSRVTAENSGSLPSLDLDSRKGKAPGGYQYMLDRSRRPFIFMNAAGLQRDVETMVHEAGHAFHSMLCNDEPLLRYRHSPIEFAEVASMSMELLTMPHWAAPGSFYAGKPADHARAVRAELESSIVLLAWIATIDAFQHWVYANPGHTRAQRTEAWLALDDRFGRDIDWSGLDDARAAAWQRQGHLFGSPFYYIEYGIAQLGALQLWLTSLERGPAAAIDAYLNALRLGGSRPLPELFRAAGLAFDFGPATVERLVARVETELAALPE